MSRITYSIYLYPRKKANGLYDLTIRRTQDRKHRFFKLGIELTKKQWDKRNKLITSHPEANDLNIRCSQELVAHKKREGFCELTGRETLNSYIKERIDSLNYAGRIATKKRYNTVLLHLTKCFGRNIHFHELNHSLVEKFKGYLKRTIKARDSHPSEKTINNYLLCIHTIYTEAKKNKKYFGENPITKELLYQVGDSVPKNLNIDELWQLNNLQINAPEHTRYTFNALNVFLFSFWSRGLRISDALNLRWSNFTKEGIYITTRKNKKPQLIRYNFFNVQYLRWYIDYADEHSIFDWKKKQFYWQEESFEDPSLRTKLTMADKEYYDALDEYSREKRRILFSTPGLNHHMASDYKAWEQIKAQIPKTTLKRLQEASENRCSCIMDIIFRHIHRSETRKDFVFPYLRSMPQGCDPQKEFNKISSSTANINKQLKKLAIKLHLTSFSTHWNRHTLGNQCAVERISPYVVKGLFNHGTLAQSEEYMGKFAVDTSEVYDKLSKKIHGY